MKNFLLRLLSFAKGLLLGALLYKIFGGLIERILRRITGTEQKTISYRAKYSPYYRSFSTNDYSSYRTKKELNDIDISEIGFNSRADAEKVLAALNKNINEFGTAKISDFKDFSGIDSYWSDTKYGWIDLERASCFRGRDGKYYLDLPTPISFD